MIERSVKTLRQELLDKSKELEEIIKKNFEELEKLKILNSLESEKDFEEEVKKFILQVPWDYPLEIESVCEVLKVQRNNSRG